MSFAKGGIVIGTPLAFWPTATSGVATELITLVEPARSLLGMPLLAHPIYQSSHIATTGIALLAIALCCWCFIFSLCVEHQDTRHAENVGKLWCIHYICLGWHP